MSDTMNNRNASRAVRESVPGKVKSTHLAGSGPGAIGYAAAVSELEGGYYVSFLQFYDPGQDLPPNPQHDVPPTMEGVVVRYRKFHDDSFSAGEDFGFFQTLLLQEGAIQNGEKEKVGLTHIQKVIDNYHNRMLAMRLYEDPDLAADPDYRREIERQLHQRIPNEKAREALESFARFEATHNEE